MLDDNFVMDKKRLTNFFSGIIWMFEAFKSVEISYILELLPYLVKILKVPDFGSSYETRNWAREITTVIDKITLITETPLDDEVLDWIDTVIEDDKAWDSLYSLFTGLLSGPDMPTAPTLATVDDVACAVKLDPSILAAIIEFVIWVVGWWRSR